MVEIMSSQAPQGVPQATLAPSVSAPKRPRQGRRVGKHASGASQVVHSPEASVEPHASVDARVSVEEADAGEEAVLPLGADPVESVQLASERKMRAYAEDLRSMEKRNGDLQLKLTVCEKDSEAKERDLLARSEAKERDLLARITSLEDEKRVLQARITTLEDDAQRILQTTYPGLFTQRHA